MYMAPYDVSGSVTTRKDLASCMAGRRNRFPRYAPETVGLAIAHDAGGTKAAVLRRDADKPGSWRLPLRCKTCEGR